MAASEKRPEAYCAIEALLSGGITPGITRRPARFDLDDRQRVGGRVHAVVRRRDALDYVCWNEEKNLCLSASSTLFAGVDMTPSMY